MFGAVAEIPDVPYVVETWRHSFGFVDHHSYIFEQSMSQVRRLPRKINYFDLSNFWFPSMISFSIVSLPNTIVLILSTLILILPPFLIGPVCWHSFVTFCSFLREDVGHVYPCSDILQPLPWLPFIIHCRYVMKVFGNIGSPWRISIVVKNYSLISWQYFTVDFKLLPISGRICVSVFPTSCNLNVAH